MHHSEQRRISVREKWHPKAGDVIITNWISWLEIVWLAFRYVLYIVTYCLSHDLNWAVSTLFMLFQLPHV